MAALINHIDFERAMSLALAVSALHLKKSRQRRIDEIMMQLSHLAATTTTTPHTMIQAAFSSVGTLAELSSNELQQFTTLRRPVPYKTYPGPAIEKGKQPVRSDVEPEKPSSPWANPTFAKSERTPVRHCRLHRHLLRAIEKLSKKYRTKQERRRAAQREWADTWTVAANFSSAMSLNSDEAQHEPQRQLDYRLRSTTSLRNWTSSRRKRQEETCSSDFWILSRAEAQQVWERFNLRPAKLSN